LRQFNTVELPAPIISPTSVGLSPASRASTARILTSAGKIFLFLVDLAEDGEPPGAVLIFLRLLKNDILSLLLPDIYRHLILGHVNLLGADYTDIN
jgi:hypothetical protein